VARLRKLTAQHVQACVGAKVEDAIEMELVNSCLRAPYFVRGYVERKVLAQASGLYLNESLRAVGVERPDVIACAIAFVLGSPLDSRKQVSSANFVQAFALEL